MLFVFMSWQVLLSIVCVSVTSPTHLEHNGLGGLVEVD